MLQISTYHKSYFFDGKSSTFYLNILLKQKTLIREKEILLQKLVLERIRMNVLDCVCAFGNFSNYHFYLNLVRYFTKIHFFIEYFHFMINETWVKVIFLIQHHACDGQYRINTW